MVAISLNLIKIAGKKMVRRSKTPGICRANLLQTAADAAFLI
jgi:hypothetical protein